MTQRANTLADRLELGAATLAAEIQPLTDEQWMLPVPHDGRTVGVIVHHVASVYPIEIQLAQSLAAGKAVEGMTLDDVHAMNAGHATEFTTISKAEALALLAANSAAAATAIRAMTDAELDGAAPLSLKRNATLSCQYMLENHAVNHSVHHLAGIREALRQTS
jgi:uncharacterized damage-inducible protein DinB